MFPMEDRALGPGLFLFSEMGFFLAHRLRSETEGCLDPGP